MPRSGSLPRRTVSRIFRHREPNRPRRQILPEPPMDNRQASPLTDPEGRIRAAPACTREHQSSGLHLAAATTFREVNHASRRTRRPVPARRRQRCGRRGRTHGRAGAWPREEAETIRSPSITTRAPGSKEPSRTLITVPPTMATRPWDRPNTQKTHMANKRRLLFRTIFHYLLRLLWKGYAQWPNSSPSPSRRLTEEKQQIFITTLSVR